MPSIWTFSRSGRTRLAFTAVALTPFARPGHAVTSNVVSSVIIIIVALCTAPTGRPSRHLALPPLSRRRASTSGTGGVQRQLGSPLEAFGLASLPRKGKNRGPSSRISPRRNRRSVFFRAVVRRSAAFPGVSAAVVWAHGGARPESARASAGHHQRDQEHAVHEHEKSALSALDSPRRVRMLTAQTTETRRERDEAPSGPRPSSARSVDQRCGAQDQADIEDVRPEHVAHRDLGLPRSAATKDAASSGRLVPTATTVSPTTRSLMPTARASLTAPSTNSLPPPPALPSRAA